MSEISLDSFAAAHADGATIVDVREPGEYVGGHVPGAVLMPMGQLPSRTGELDRPLRGGRHLRVGPLAGPIVTGRRTVDGVSLSA